MTEVPRGEHATFSFLDLITLALVLEAIPDLTHGKVLDGIACLWLAFANHAIGVRWAVSRYLVPPMAITVLVYSGRWCLTMPTHTRFILAACLGAVISPLALAAYAWIGQSPGAPHTKGTEIAVNKPSDQGIGPSGPPPKIPSVPETFPPDENGNPVGGGGITVGGGASGLDIHNNRVARDIRVVRPKGDHGADLRDSHISNNSFGGNSVIDNAGKIEGAEISGNRVRGDHATAVKNETDGEIRTPLKIQNNDIGESPTRRVDWHEKQNWRQLLRKGMSRTEVRQLFGDPDQVSVAGRIESWEYGSGRISFDTESHSDGSLYSWGEPLEHKVRP